MSAGVGRFVEAVPEGVPRSGKAGAKRPTPAAAEISLVSNVRAFTFSASEASGPA